MKRIEKIEVEGKTYPLVFSLAVANRISEKYGSMQLLGEKISNPRKYNINEIDLITDILFMLMEQGVAYVNTISKNMTRGEYTCFDMNKNKYVSLTKDELQTMLAIDDIEFIIDIIGKTMETSQKKKVDAKVKEKGKKKKHR